MRDYNDTSSRFRNAVHRQGMIINNCGDKINVEMVLFDSGSSSDNFISSNFVKKCGDKLLKDMVHKKLRVKVADGHQIELQGYIPVTIAFEDDGKTYKAQLSLYVLDGLAKDIIIGLPAICEHFSELFMNMIKKASLSVEQSVN